MGSRRRLGAIGPVYEIVGKAQLSVRGQRMMRIRVPETGEEIDYDVSDILDDPRDL